MLDFSVTAGYGFCAVRKLPEVEEANALMTEAMDWSVFTWLFNKSRVRETADRANAALDKLNRTTKSHWSDEVKVAYKELTMKAVARRSSNPGSETIDTKIALFVSKVREADEAAHRARRDAEDTFDEAERQMSTDLAREGCKKAIHQWELDEKAIRRAEAVPDAENNSKRSPGKATS